MCARARMGVHVVCGVYVVFCTVLFHKVSLHCMHNLCVMCAQAYTYQVCISKQDISSYSEAAKSGTELVSSPTHLDHVILILVAMSICC